MGIRYGKKGLGQNLLLSQPHTHYFELLRNVSDVPIVMTCGMTCSASSCLINNSAADWPIRSV